MNLGFIKKTIMAFAVSIFLGYIIIKTKDLLTRIVVIPFLIFGFSKINVISFFIYYFGFLIYWDYVAITNKDYILVAFSLLAWAGGIFALYRRYLRLRNTDKIVR